MSLRSVSNEEPDLRAGGFCPLGWTRREQCKVEVGTLSPRELRVLPAHPGIFGWLVLIWRQRDFEHVPVDVERGVEIRGVQDDENEPAEV